MKIKEIKFGNTYILPGLPRFGTLFGVSMELPKLAMTDRERFLRFGQNDFGNKGYVAVSTVIVVGAVVLAIGISVIMNGINEVQSAFAETQQEKALALVNACARDGMIRLNKNNTIPASIVLPEGSCTVTINSHTGSSWDITFSGTFNGYTKSVRITATRSSTIVINSWKQI